MGIDLGKALSHDISVRVVLINQVFYPDPQSTGQHLSGLAEGLVKQGHDVTVLTGQREYDNPQRCYPGRESWRGIDIIRVWSSGFGHGAKWRRALDFFTFMVTAAVRALFLSRADVVVALTTPPLISVLGAMLALLWRGRFIYWVMDLNPDEAVAIGWLRPDSPMTHLLDRASRWSMRRAEWIIVLDEYMQARVVAKGIEAQKVVALPIWMHGEIHFDAAGRERFRREHGLEDKFVVMYSGNHTPVHPLGTLVDAARCLRDDSRIHFCFVGGGIEWRRWRDRSLAEAWSNVSFIGYQPFEALAGSLSAADTQVVVMGDAFPGIVHPCKVYNLLTTERPFIFIGPERCHVADLIREIGLGEVATSFLHGEGKAVADELQKRAQAAAMGAKLAWPPADRLAYWTETTIVGKLVRLIESSKPDR